MDEYLLNDLLECSVCLDRLDTSSRVLPCQHTFCRKCLEEIVSTKKELRCPECRVLVSKSIDELPPNVLLMRILEGMKNAGNAIPRKRQAPMQRLFPPSSPCVAPPSQILHASGEVQMPKTPLHTPPKQNLVPGPPTARALYDYQSLEPEDLSFRKGELIRLLSKIDTHWAQGECAGRTGIFPLTFVQVLTPLPPQVATCRALYDFRMNNDEVEGCLSFRKDEVLSVLRRVDENWIEGRLNGRIGIFPLAFVDLNPVAKALMKLSANEQPGPSRVAPPTPTTEDTTPLIPTDIRSQDHVIVTPAHARCVPGPMTPVPAGNPSLQSARLASSDTTSSSTSPNSSSNNSGGSSSSSSSTAASSPVSPQQQQSSHCQQQITNPAQQTHSQGPVSQITGATQQITPLFTGAPQQSSSQFQSQMQLNSSPQPAGNSQQQNTSGHQQFSSPQQYFTSPQQHFNPQLLLNSSPQGATSQTLFTGSPPQGATRQQLFTGSPQQLPPQQQLSHSPQQTTTTPPAKISQHPKQPTPHFHLSGTATAQPSNSQIASYFTQSQSHTYYTLHSDVAFLAHSKQPSSLPQLTNVDQQVPDVSSSQADSSKLTNAPVLAQSSAQQPAAANPFMRPQTIVLPTSHITTHQRDKRHSFTAITSTASTAQAAATTNRHSAEILGTGDSTSVSSEASCSQTAAATVTSQASNTQPRDTVTSQGGSLQSRDLVVTSHGGSAASRDSQSNGGLVRHGSQRHRRSGSDFTAINLPAAYVALYPYKPQKADELELKKGGVYLVTERCQDGWFKGTSNRTQKSGVFPGNYVTLAKPVQNSHSRVVSSSPRDCPTPNPTPVKSRSPAAAAVTTATAAQQAALAALAPPELPPRSASPAVRPQRPWGSPAPAPDHEATQGTAAPPPPPPIKPDVTSSGHDASQTAHALHALNTLQAVHAAHAAHISNTISPPPNVSVALSPTVAKPSEKVKEKKEKGGLMKRLAAIKRSKSPTVPAPVYSMDNPVFEDSSSAATTPHAAHSRSGSCPSQLLHLPVGVQSQRAMSTSLSARVTRQKERPALVGAQFTQSPSRAADGSCGPTASTAASHRKSSSLDAGDPRHAKHLVPSVRERFRCIVPYPPNSEYELELRVGDVIYVHRKREDGWYKGTLQRTGRTGLFPASFVESY